MKKLLAMAALVVLLGAFGAFTATSTADAKTLTYKGSGDKIIKIGKPSGKQTEAVVVKISYSGSSNFVVWALNKKLKQTDLLVNTIGDYKGTVPLDFAGGSATYRLQIQAEGDWKVVIKPWSSQRRFTGKVSGHGDDVVLYEGGARVATIKYDGESNFVVWAYYANSSDLLVNEIGKYKGQSVLSGKAVITLSADGPWSIVTK